MGPVMNLAPGRRPAGGRAVPGRRGAGLRGPAAGGRRGRCRIRRPRKAGIQPRRPHRLGRRPATSTPGSSSSSRSARGRTAKSRSRFDPRRQRARRVRSRRSRRPTEPVRDRRHRRAARRASAHPRRSTPGEPAERAGLKPGDVILADQRRADHVPHRSCARRSRSIPSKPITVSILRDGAPSTTSTATPAQTRRHRAGSASASPTRPRASSPAPFEAIEHERRAERRDAGPDLQDGLGPASRARPRRSS